MLKIGALFSGIGGLERGLEQAGLGRVIWHAEIDPFCQRVLARHWPDAHLYTDVREVTADAPRVDILIGGFPCQDVSNAGNRAGIDGERSGLWGEYVRIIRALRPAVVVVENVPGLLVRGAERVFGELAAAGYDAEWDVLGAVDVGAPHLRKRVFIVATQSALPDAERDRLREQWQRHRQQHEEPREAVARVHGQDVADPDEPRPQVGRGFGTDAREERETAQRDRSGADARQLHLADALGPRSEGQSGSGPDRAAAGSRTVSGHGGEVLVADGDGSGREGRDEVREGQPVAHGSGALADGDSGRPQGLRVARGSGRRGEHGPRGDESDRRDMPQWPPAPDDVLAWGQVPAEAQPAVCRLADGFSPGLDWIVGPTRREALKAFGNAVVPQVAERVGRTMVWPAIERMVV